MAGGTGSQPEGNSTTRWPGFMEKTNCEPAQGRVCWPNRTLVQHHLCLPRSEELQSKQQAGMKSFGFHAYHCGLRIVFALFSLETKVISANFTREALSRHY